MTSEPELNMTARDKVLLHLKDYWQHQRDSEFPVAVTQKGISEMTGVRRTHVPRTLKRLITKDLVQEVQGHIKGERRRYKSYFLTETGLAEASHLLDSFKSIVVTVDGVERSIGELLESEKGVGRFRLLMRLNGEDASSLKSRPVVVGPVPEVLNFVDREEELAHLKELLVDPVSRIMVIYGSRGYGKSALAAKLVEEACNDWSVCWVQVRKDLDEMLDSIIEALANTFPDLVPGLAERKDPEALARMLEGKMLLLVCDAYFDVSEDVVEYFTGLVSAMKGAADFKLLVTAREDTPSYNRFYTILDLHDGTVGEVHLRGLDMEHCKVMLGTPDIAPDALRRLFLFTRGKPPTLKLLAEGDENALRENTTFSPEEIKLMLFLKGQKGD